MSRPMVEVEDLHKSFGANKVLDGIDLSVASGEVVCIIGPSGSGKSTLLRCINHLEIPERGRIRIDGAVAYRDEQGAGFRAHRNRAVAAVRVHLDRVHDAVLRAGCTPADAVDLVRATALSLVERSAAGPCSADEAVGRWFADAQASAQQLAGPSATLPVDDRQRGLQTALDDLPEQERLAVLLRVPQVFRQVDQPADHLGG